MGRARRCERLVYRALVWALALVCLCLAPQVAYGEQEQDSLSPQLSPNLSLEVTYDANVKCGVPTVFTCSAQNGSGNYIYEFNAVRRKDASGYYSELVIDPTKQAYTSSFELQHDFSFTFMASGTYQLIFYTVDQNETPYSSARQLVYITVNDPSYPDVYTRARQIVDQCGARSLSTDYEKALVLHDWIIDNMYYHSSSQNTGDDFTFVAPEGSLSRGQGVCEAYHRGYRMLLDEVGIQNADVTGNGHIWTAAKLDGKWYQIDTTSDDINETFTGYPDLEQLRHLYFGITDHMMHLIKPDHPDGGISGYTSNSLDCNWLYRTTRVLEYSSEYESDIEPYLQNGDDEFSLSIHSKHLYWPAGYKDLIFNVVAYQLQNQGYLRDGETVRYDVSYADNILSFRTHVEQQEPVAPTQPNVNPPTDLTQTVSKAMYRLYNKYSGEHLFTGDADELKRLVKLGWKSEGIAWQAPESGSPVYRLYNKYSGDHHFTTDKAEYVKCRKAGWTGEGIAYYSGGSTPVYRLYNKYVTSFYHHYTTDLAEYRKCLKQGWKDEGIGWYGM